MIENLTASLWPIASWVLFASCKSIAVIALVLTCRQLLAPWLSAQARHSLWFAVIACLAVPFGMQVDLKLTSDTSLRAAAVTVENAKEDTTAASVQLPILNEPDRGTEALSRLDAATSPVTQLDAPQSIGVQANGSVRLLFIVVWLGFGFILLSAALWNLLRYFQIRSLAQEIAPVAGNLFQQCKAQLNVRRNVRLLQATEINSPAIFGWWSPTLLLPLDLASQLNEKQLRYVFLHELTHVQRQDILLNWLMAIVQIAHWFNPFVWYALRVMRNDMEQACDAKVMAHLSAHERVEYGKTLIRMTDFYTGPMFSTHGVGVVESHSQLKERIKMISQFNPKRIRYSMVAAVVLTAITSVAVTQPRSDSEAEPKVSNESVSLPAGVSGQQPVVRLAALPSEPATPGENVSSSNSKAPAQGASTQRPAPPSAPKADKLAETKSPEVSATAANAMAKDSILMGDLVRQVSINTHKKFVVDPRVKGIVVTLVGQKLDQIDYSGLLTILRINGCTAFELNGYVNVVPVSDARSMPVPIAIEGKDYPDDQWVSMTLGLKNACAAQLVPMLRPLLPQYGYMAAERSSNSLTLMDTFANVKRIASMAKDLDARSTSNGQCGDNLVKSGETPK